MPIDALTLSLSYSVIFIKIIFYYALANMLARPRQFVPPSSVIKTNTSTPVVVKVGAVPPGHLTVAGHVIAADPAFVNSITNPHAFGEAKGLEKVHVVIPATVAEK
jgi:hypothetical protein